MLTFDLRALSQGGVQVDGRLAPTDPVWTDQDVRPADGVRVTGRLSGAGGGRYYFSGRIAGTAETSCRRCLGDASASVNEEVHFLYAPAGDETADDDPDVYTLDGRATAVDLRAAVRESWVLAAPQYTLCRDDCKGLCPNCGADLNDGPCDCGEKTDARWDSLKQLTAKRRS